MQNIKREAEERSGGFIFRDEPPLMHGVSLESVRGGNSKFFRDLLDRIGQKRYLGEWLRRLVRAGERQRVDSTGTVRGGPVW